MNASIYTRFSTELQQSTEMQVEQCKKYAIKNNLNIVKIYSDEGNTGTNMNRHCFEELLYDATNKLFEVIIIYDVTRGSRDVSDWFNFRKLMRQLNISVVSTSEKLGDIYDPANFLQELITVGIGQHAVLSTRIKSIAGKTTQARHGLFQGGYPPYGYDIIKQKYIINMEESKVVKQIFKLYVEGCSYLQILEEIEASTLRGKRGQPFTKTSIYSILNNPRYTGVFIWNKNINREMKKWVGKKNQNTNVVEIENSIPQIIDSFTFEKAQKRLADKKHRARNKAKAAYLLSGKIECGICGEEYVGKTNTNGKGFTSRYYVCINKYRTKLCSAHNINAILLENSVCNAVKTYFQKLNLENIKHSFENLTNIKTYTENEKKNLVNITRKITNLKYAIKTATAIELINDFNEEINKLYLVKNQIESIIQKKESNVIIDYELIFKKLKKDAECLSENNIQHLVKEYVKKIYAYDDYIIINIGVNTVGSSSREVPLYTIKLKIPKSKYNNK